MAKKKLRNIIVADTKFCWNFNPAYQLLNAATRQYCCYDKFRAYAAGNRTSPLEIVFITSEDPIYGGALRLGAPLVPSVPDTGGVNLHTPKWAATLIWVGLQQGWQPHAKSSPFTIADGVQLLASLNYRAERIFQLTGANDDRSRPQPAPPDARISPSLLY